MMCMMCMMGMMGMTGMTDVGMVGSGVGLVHAGQFLLRCILQVRQSHIINQNTMWQHLDSDESRCGLRPNRLVPGVATKTRLESSMMKRKPHFNHDCCVVSGGTRPLGSRSTKAKSRQTWNHFRPKITVRAPFRRGSSTFPALCSLLKGPSHFTASPSTHIGQCFASGQNLILNLPNLGEQAPSPACHRVGG